MRLIVLEHVTEALMAALLALLAWLRRVLKAIDEGMMKVEEFTHRLIHTFWRLFVSLLQVSVFYLPSIALLALYFLFGSLLFLAGSIGWFLLITLLAIAKWQSVEAKEEKEYAGTPGEGSRMLIRALPMVFAVILLLIWPQQQYVWFVWVWYLLVLVPTYIARRLLHDATGDTLTVLCMAFVLPFFASFGLPVLAWMCEFCGDQTSKRPAALCYSLAAHFGGPTPELLMKDVDDPDAAGEYMQTLGELKKKDFSSVRCQLSKEAKTHHQNKRYREEIRSLSMLIAIDDSNEQRYREDRATAFNKLGEYDFALADVTRALKLAWNPYATDRPVRGYCQISDADLFYMRGLIYMQQEKYSKAVEEFDTAVKIWPHKKEVYLKRSEAFAAIGNTKKAAEDLRMAEEEEKKWKKKSE